MIINKLASKEELKQGLMDYFDAKDNVSTTYTIGLIEERLDDCFDVSDMDEINEVYIDDIVEYIFKHHVKSL